MTVSGKNSFVIARFNSWTYAKLCCTQHFYVLAAALEQQHNALLPTASNYYSLAFKQRGVGFSSVKSLSNNYLDLFFALPPLTLFRAAYPRTHQLGRRTMGWACAPYKWVS